VPLFVPLLLAGSARANEATPEPREKRPPVTQTQEPREISWGYEEESFDPPSWRRQQGGHPLLRLAGAASYARLPAEGRDYVGGSLSIAFEGSFSVSPELNRWFFGNRFGVEARAHVFRSLEAEAGAWLVAAGLTIPMAFTAQEYGSFERVRIPSPFGVLVPEAGVALRSPQPTSFYLRWSAPVAVLIDRNVAVELVPAVLLLYRTPTGAVTPLWQLSLAFSWRDLGRPNILVRSPSPSRSL
jgi:hypothetical protein